MKTLFDRHAETMTPMERGLAWERVAIPEKPQRVRGVVFRAAPIVDSPAAKVAAIRRRFADRPRSHSSKSIRLAANSAGVQLRSSTKTSFQPCSMSNLSSRSTRMPRRRWA